MLCCTQSIKKWQYIVELLEEDSLSSSRASTQDQRPAHSKQADLEQAQHFERIAWKLNVLQSLLPGRHRGQRRLWRQPQWPSWGPWICSSSEFSSPAEHKPGLHCWSNTLRTHLPQLKQVHRVNCCAKLQRSTHLESYFIPNQQDQLVHVWFWGQRTHLWFCSPPPPPWSHQTVSAHSPRANCSYLASFMLRADSASDSSRAISFRILQPASAAATASGPWRIKRKLNPRNESERGIWEIRFGIVERCVCCMQMGERRASGCNEYTSLCLFRFTVWFEHVD